MIGETRIFPECDADTLLVELIRKKTPQHCFGNSRVAAQMEKRLNSRDTHIGVVDSDKFKRTPHYLKTFKKEIATEKSGLILRQKDKTNQYLVFIHPKFEPWIWKCAELAQLKPSRWGFNTIDQLYAVTKHGAFENQRLKNFLNAIVQKNPPPINQLRKWFNTYLE